jgi:hypothetical protein
MRRGRRWSADRRQSADRRLVAALVEAERWVAVRHQGDVAGDPQNPPVQAEDEVEDRLGIAAGEQQHRTGDQDEQPDEAEAEQRLLVGTPDAVRETAEEEPNDQVVGDGQQPPLDQNQSPGEVLGVVDVEMGGVVRHVGQGEWRILVRAQSGIGVVADAPTPAHDPDVEVEQRPRVVRSEQDAEKRHNAGYSEREPEEREHDVVWDRQ